MTPLAERLPVADAPKQGLVTSMRNYVVHNCGGSHSTGFMAMNTNWIRGQKYNSRSLPFVSIATFRCRAAPDIILRFQVAWLCLVPGWFQGHCAVAHHHRVQLLGSQ